MKKIISIAAACILSVSMLVGCNKSSTEGFKDTITFAGASTIAPIIDTATSKFKAEYKTWKDLDKSFGEKEVSIVINSGGSGEGIKGIIDGVSDFGLVSREVSEDEKGKIKEYKQYNLGVDALTIAINPKNPLVSIKDDLTTEQVKSIFSGKYKFWDELDKGLPHNEIIVVTRDLAGGAHKVFQEKVMAKDEVKADVIQAPSMGALVEKIIQNENAIGYASFGVVNQNKGKIKPLKVDGIEPSRENILSGSYKIARPLLVINNGEPTKQEKYFIDYLTSDKGKAIVEELGFLPSK
ncbi:MAG: phosphate ABC transporter substrate-binding protein [Clostridium sp.]